jgi:multidrug efflux pump subunit AcrB
VVDSIARSYGASVKVAEIPPGPPVQSTLVAEIYGPSYEEQVDVARQVREVFASTNGIVDVDWSVAHDHEQLQATIRQAEALRSQTNSLDIARTIVASVYGGTVGLLHDEAAAEPVNITVSIPDSGVSSVADLAAIPVSTPGGGRRLGTLAHFESVEVPTPIHHKNLKPVVYVTADVAGELESPAYGMLAMQSRLEAIVPNGQVKWTDAPTLTEDVSIVWDGEWDITRDVFRDLGIAFGAVLILIYVLVVAWFQSFTTPLVIMAPIPLTLIGILPAHALTGAFFTATSMIGMIALSGIIVRNSILLVDFVHIWLERGHTLTDAVVTSGLIRSRPIVLTAAAVVIGGMVMVRDPIFEGLGMALVSGAVVATALTLVAIPLLFFEMHRHRAS